MPENVLDDSLSRGERHAQAELLVPHTALADRKVDR